MTPRRPRLRLAVAGGLLLAATVIGLLIGLPSGESFEESIDGLGAAAPVGFGALYAALTVAMLPGAVLTIASGAIFGVALGAVVTFAGAMTGATLAFLIGRRISRASVEAVAGDALKRADERLAERGLAAMVLLRLVPLVPFNALNYAAGATAVSLRDYVLGTAIGIVPATVAFNAAGAGAAEPTSPGFIAAAVALALLTVGGSVAARRMS